MSKIWGARAAAAGAVLLWTLPLLAQREVPIGGRTATMGGAGTAAGNDSAMPYLNPAGIAGLPSDIFAVSASIYAYQHLSIDDFFAPEGHPAAFGPAQVEKDDISTSSVLEVPTSVMYFKRLSQPGSKLQMLAGVSLVIPSLERTEIVASMRTRFPSIDGVMTESGSVARSRTDYYAGPTYALGIGDSLRLGLSLYGLFVHEFESIQYTQFFSAAGGSIVSQTSDKRAVERNSFAFAPIAGVQVKLANHVWLGLGLAVPTLHLDGSLEREFESSGGGNDPADPASSVSESTTTSIDDGHHYADRPLRLNAGIAYDDRERFSFAADIVYFHSRNNAVADRGILRGAQLETAQLPRFIEQPFDSDLDSEPVVDFSVGTEIVLSTLVALRLGGFTSFTSQPELTLDRSELYRFRMQRFGGTLGLGFRLGSFDSTIGGVYMHSSGDFVTLDGRPASEGGTAGGPTKVGASAHTLFLVLSGAVTTDEAKDTIRKTLPVDFPVDPTQIEPVPGFDAAPLTPAAPAPAAPPPPPPPPPPPAAPPPPPPAAPPPAPPPSLPPPTPAPAEPPPPAEPTPPPAPPLEPQPGAVPGAPPAPPIP